MSSKWKFLSVLMIGALILPACKKDPGERAEHIVKKVSKKLDLNEEQKGKLEKIKVELLRLHAQNAEKKSDRSEKMKALILSEELDKKEVLSMIEERRSSFEANLPQVFDLVQDFHKSLSLEQKQKLVGLMEKFQEKRKRHKDK